MPSPRAEEGGAIGDGHAGRRIDRCLDDPGLEQRRIEAIAGMREVGLHGSGPQAGG